MRSRPEASTNSPAKSGLGTIAWSGFDIRQTRSSAAMHRAVAWNRIGDDVMQRSADMRVRIDQAVKPLGSVTGSLNRRHSSIGMRSPVTYDTLHTGSDQDPMHLGL